MSFARTPLAGLAIVVTRAEAKAGELIDKLERLGAQPIGVPTIEIAPPSDGGVALQQALAAGEVDQIVVASPNGAAALISAAAGLDSIDLAPVACVGPSTAATLDDSPFHVNLVPERAVAEGLVEAMGQPATGRDRLLLAQAEVARPVLAEGLSRLGWRVTRVVAYRTVDATVTEAARVRSRRGDVITFTSSSTVDRFVRLVGVDATPAVIATIGPVTSNTAREHGLVVDVEANPHTIDGLVQAIVDWRRAQSS